ncbi:hypothetical protein ABMA28_011028 [Loxostege sticticalis]|uniref:Uncharacterized protein n=1 Tax=Loxostege sticticalis TaxID=481309 RepID=A0ABD0S733_LOXSC
MQNLNLEPLIEEYEADLSEIAGGNKKKTEDDSLSALEEMDPKKAITSIIFDSDSEKSKSPKNEENIEIDDDCQIVEGKVETCELSDDSDIVFKAEQTNVAVCIVTNKKEDDKEIDKTVPNEIFAEDAIDPKLKMVPIVRLERTDELLSNVKLKRPQGNKIPDKLAAHKDREGSDTLLNVKATSQDAIVELQNDIDVQVTVKGEAIGDEEKFNVESDRPRVRTRSGTLKGSPETLQNRLIGYKIPDEDTPKDIDPDKGGGKRRERPWGYKGPLTGRVEDLSWLCTSISIALEKLPEEVLNNMKTNPVSRRVWLPDIEQVRRDNKRMLVAQVAPLLHTKEPPPAQRLNRALSCESSNTSRSGTLSADDYGLLSQMSDGEDYEWEISEAQLQQILNVAQEKFHGPAYCCLARRHRALNDARRRHALRMRRAAPPEHDLHG